MYLEIAFYWEVCNMFINYNCPQYKAYCEVAGHCTETIFKMNNSLTEENRKRFQQQQIRSGKQQPLNY